MIHKHIKSLPHHPKRVILISLVIALVVGTYAYNKINKKVAIPVVADNSNANINDGADSSSANLTLGFLSGGRIKSVSVKAGDAVKKGQVLATLDAENTLGALSQAKAAYETAQANYQKIINGATSAAIDVAKAAVHTAEVNLEGVKKQQDLLVASAYQTLLNSSIAAIPSTTSGSVSISALPTITGTYTLGKEGDIRISPSPSSNNDGNFNSWGLINFLGKVSTSIPEPIGDTGLFIVFPVNYFYPSDLIISIPNKKAPNYLSNSNAYQSALETKNQAISNAQALQDQANASLLALESAARPEDVAVAKAQVDNANGAVQVAESAYKNTIITAPSDGTILSVIISPGQIAMPNAPAFEFISTAN